MSSVEPDDLGGRWRRPLLAAALASVTLALGACGGSSNDATGTASAKLGHDTVTNGVVTHKPLHGTGGSEANDDNPGSADTGDGAKSTVRGPCALVSAAAAEAIVGQPLKPPEEAPQGPTCIYAASHGGGLVTLAVEPLELGQILPHTKKLVRGNVGAHASYCGVYGQPNTYVKLSHGLVLSVSASCSVGERFALEAVKHLRPDGTIVPSSTG